MVKRILKIFLEIVIVIITYLLQIYVVNNTLFFGVRGDLCLMLIATIALLGNNLRAYVYAIICGLLSDIIFSSGVAKYLVIYVIVVSVLIGLKKMYNQDSKAAIIIFAAISVIIAEIIKYLFEMLSSNVVNVFSFIMLVFKEGVINIFLAYILYVIYAKVINIKE